MATRNRDKVILVLELTRDGWEPVLTQLGCFRKKGANHFELNMCTRSKLSSLRRRAFRRAFLMFCRWWPPFGRWGVDRWIEIYTEINEEVHPK